MIKKKYCNIFLFIHLFISSKIVKWGQCWLLLCTNILQNIFFSQKKVSNTGLEQHKGEKIHFCVNHSYSYSFVYRELFETNSL